MAKAPPFLAAKKGPKGAVAVGKTKRGNPFAAAKLKEGSPAEEALDRKQDMQGFKKGGRVKKK